MTLNKKNSYLVATSGGPDSVFLVHWLWNHGYHNLVLAHVNYHWRKESNDDQKIVEQLAHKFNLPLEIKNLSAHQEKPQKENFEGWARKQRYEFFASLKNKYHSSHVVVGHQENDLIETFLMQKERKNLVQYYGLAEITNHHNLKIWRPLLAYKKSEIIAWLNQNKITYAIDKTNYDLKLKRNLIRSQLNENEFEKIKVEITQSNLQNQKWTKIAQAYLAKNQKNEDLLLTDEIKTWNKEKAQRLIYLFFKSQNLESKLIGRKKQILNEISKRLLQSDKNFWVINLDNQILLKDYNFLRFVNTKDLPNNLTIIKTKADLMKLEKFANQAQIMLSIKENNYDFPYEIWTLNPIQIKGAKWQGKSLQNLLGKQRLSYKKRFKLGVIYSLKQKQILDTWQWKIA